MSRHVARYSITTGLAGCYMPDCHHGAHEFTTRRELAQEIRGLVMSMGWPARAARQVSVRNIWSHIARHGSSSAHFSLQHNGFEIAFHGLTDAEFEQAQAEQDC